MKQISLLSVAGAAFASACLLTGASLPTAVRTASNAPPKRPLAQEAYGKLPLCFEANRGQAEKSVNFLARGPGYTLALSPAEARFVLRRNDDATNSTRHNGESVPNSPSRELRMILVGARPEGSVEGSEELEGKVNYLIGNDPGKWRTGVPTYGRVRYSEVYPGIDVIYYGNQNRLEYDFQVSPGSDPGVIALEFADASGVELEEATGDLLVRVGDEAVRQHAPITYQETANGRREIESRYALREDGRVGFEVGEYDKSLPLVIDPVLVYSTFLGGFRSDIAYGIAVDADGSTYVVGETNSPNFPLANPSKDPHGLYDVFVTKINAAGNALIYSTYLGGSGDDFGRGIAVDAAGNAYITGNTIASDYPTVNPIQATYGGNNRTDAFVTKINASGSAILFSTFLGGSQTDVAESIALDAAGNTYVTGTTSSANFPIANAFRGTLSGTSDAFLAKINATGAAFIYSTYLGGSNTETGHGIAADSDGNAYVTGTTFSTNFPLAAAIQATYAGGSAPTGGDAYVTKINSTGSALVYSTYLGGSAPDVGQGIAVDAAGNAYVTGRAGSNFPIANALQPTFAGAAHDAFVTKINPAGSALVYSTYLGGTDGGDGQFNQAIAVDSGGNAYITGATSADNFPLVNPIQGTRSGLEDAYVTKINAAGSALVYSTYLGGTGNEDPEAIAVDALGNTYVVGSTESRCFPTTDGSFDTTFDRSPEAFVFKLSETGSPATLVACPTPSPAPTPTPMPTPRPGQNFVVANTNDSGPGSLRQAVLDANLAPGADTITFDQAFFSTPRTITLTSGALEILNSTNSNVNIIGPGAALLTVSGNNNSRIFTIALPAIVSLSDLTLTGGNGAGPNPANNRGGAIYNATELTLSGVVIAGNSAAAEGGGVYTDSGRTLRVLGCTISNNTSNSDNSGNGHGGGIYNAGSASLTVTDSVVIGNTAQGGLSSGGGIWQNGPTTIERTTIRDNSASGTGGGIQVESSLSMTTSTISGNQAGGDGGGIWSDSLLLQIENSTISGNRSGDQGGGIFYTATFGPNFSFVTIVDNIAVNDGGGIHTVTTSSPLSIDNTILANNTDNGTAPDGKGSIRSDRYNLIENTTGIVLTGNTTGNIIGQDPVLGPLQDNGGPTQTHLPLAGSPVIDAANPISSSATALFDQRGVPRPLDGNGDGTARADIGAVEEGVVPSRLLNIATRMRVLTGDSALIGGFIITGNDPKRVIIRGIGPSTNIPGALANPTLELFDANSTLLTSNDDWRSNQAEVEATTIPPSDDLESAIVQTLSPGSYTAVLRGLNNTTGIGVVEVYDLSSAANSTLANISSRGFVDAGDNAMIGGFIVGGGGGARVLIRGIGPSLASFFPNALENPTLELRDANGSLIRENNDWRDSQEAEIQGTTIPPSNDLESAILASVGAGSYTAILRGAGNATGVGVVEVYNLR